MTITPGPVELWRETTVLLDDALAIILGFARLPRAASEEDYAERMARLRAVIAVYQSRLDLARAIFEAGGYDPKLLQPDAACACLTAALQGWRS